MSGLAFWVLLRTLSRIPDQRNGVFGLGQKIASGRLHRMLLISLWTFAGLEDPLRPWRVENYPTSFFWMSWASKILHDEDSSACLFVHYWSSQCIDVSTILVIEHWRHIFNTSNSTANIYGTRFHAMPCLRHKYRQVSHCPTSTDGYHFFYLFLRKEIIWYGMHNIRKGLLHRQFCCVQHCVNKYW